MGGANRESLNYFKMSGSQGPLYLDERQSLVCVYVCVGGGRVGGPLGPSPPLVPLGPLDHPTFTDTTIALLTRGPKLFDSVFTLGKGTMSLRIARVFGSNICSTHD